MFRRPLGGLTLWGERGQVELKMYAGQTHTSPLIENPMRGGCDKLVDDIISFVLGEEVHTRNAALCPAFLINLAALVCPF